jgi:hypothetical protein
MKLSELVQLANEILDSGKDPEVFVGDWESRGEIEISWMRGEAVCIKARTLVEPADEP